MLILQDLQEARVSHGGDLTFFLVHLENFKMILPSSFASTGLAICA